MRWVTLLSVVCLWTGAGQATAQQGETLADIRQDIVVLQGELDRLKQELNTTGGLSSGLGGSALDRITTIEAELQRVTSKTEQLEFRLNRIVSDGTNRLGDLQFRVCDMDPGCDIATLGQTAPLGGAEAASVAPAAAPAPPPATDSLGFDGQLAVSEEADFVEARDALDAGDGAAAVEMFARFRETYPGSPLEAQALVGEGRAYEVQGNTREAARRYLQAYSGYPDARTAPEALWRLGVSLAALGSTPEACVTLAEVGNRYAGSDFVARAQSSRSELGCQ
jgi:tol-pal system protein YbgF